VGLWRGFSFGTNVGLLEFDLVVAIFTDGFGLVSIETAACSIFLTEEVLFGTVCVALCWLLTEGCVAPCVAFFVMETLPLMVIDLIRLKAR